MNVQPSFPTFARQTALRRLTWQWITALALLVLIFAGLPAQHVYADSLITVNSVADNATAGDGACTLREAINNANSDSDTTSGDCVAGSGADTITFDSSLSNATITLGSLLPNITDDLTIDGSSLILPVTIDGAGTYRVFYVDSITVTLDSLIISHGASSNGGGLYNNGGAVNITDSTFSDNSTACTGSSCNSQGGGVYNDGTLNITNSTFSHNNAACASFACHSWGGGIYNNGGTLTVTNSTFSDNSTTCNYDYCGSEGGGILKHDPSTLPVTNSTFSGNSAACTGHGCYSLGGGIFDNGTLTVTNSTFSGNSAACIGSSCISQGGGIKNYFDATLNLTNTIIANSTAGGDCQNTGGTIGTDSHNLIESTGANACGLINGVNGDIIGSDPNLGPLADNGGPTQTMALQVGSVAIDAGDDGNCPATDQRGVTRPQGAHCDVGAFESEAQTGPTFTVNSLADTNDNSCDPLGSGLGNQDCTLREAINAANAIAGANTITFSVSGTIILGSTLPEITTEMTIDGAGQSVTVSGNNAYRVLSVNASGTLSLNSLTIANGLNKYSTETGAGIHNLGTLNISDSTFTGNETGVDGGAIANEGTLAVVNSTFTGNYADLTGAGILNQAALTITNSTFSGNTSASEGDDIMNDGGTVNLVNSILASGDGNPIRSCYSFNSGSLTADSYNIDSDGSCDNASTYTTAQINLGSLADNGGPTQTMALQPGSVAINAGDDTNCPVTDQRGVTRPQGLHCDVGAFELEGQMQSGPTFTVNTVDDHDDGFCAPDDCTLREAINAANAIAGANTIDFSVSGTITLGSNLPEITSEMTIDGVGQSVTVSGNNAYRVLSVNASGTLNLNALTVADGLNQYSPETGAGIHNLGTLNISDSTFTGNETGVDGGAIDNEGTLAVVNSTFTGNYADLTGAGILNKAALTITNSTFSGNTGAGEGRDIMNDGGTVNLVNSILASGDGNPIRSCYSFNSGSLSADSYNIDSDGSCDNASTYTTAQINLGSLADNGGPTQTMALQPGSVAINAGDDTNCPVTDQRGVTRPQGLHCDVGAFEAEQVDGTPPVITPTISGTLGDNNWYTSDVTVSWTVSDDESAVTSTTGCDATTIDSDTTGTALTCEATSEGGTNSASVTIKRDATPPTASASLFPAANANGWNNSDVIVSFSGNDATSGIASCDADVILSSEGSNQLASGTCSDNAGNDTTVTASGINIDETAPVVSVTGVTDGATYYLGSVPAAGCDTSDALSGVETSASLTLSGGAPDGTGTFTATCDGALDNAGNSGSASMTYNVEGAPTITTQPQDQSIASGQTATLTVVASGSSLHYHWYQGTSGDTTTQVGSDSDSFTTPALTADTSYWVRVSNPAGHVDSVTATVTINRPPTITSTNSTTFTEGVAGNFTVTTTAGVPTVTTLSESGALPGGVSFTDNGDGTASLSGTPATGTSGSYNLSLTASNGISPDATQDFTLTVLPAPVQITVETDPGGLSFTVDGTTYTSAQTLTWTPGTSHTLATSSPQAGTPGMQYAFDNWSDDGALSHSVTAPSADSTYTATFKTQYELTTAVNPSNAGSISPDSGTYYDADTEVSLTASPNSGFTFLSWTGDVADSSAASTSITMSGPQSVTANFKASTSLLYNGDQLVNIGNNLKLAAQLSSPASACVSGQTIDFSLDVNPLDGSAGPYSLGSATTGSDGQATLSLSTSGWQEGIYDITASFAGTTDCDPSSDDATLTAASPGNSATGGGWYPLPGSGHINFGFNVRKVDNKCKTDCAYKGQMLLINNGKWRLKGTLDSYVKTSTNQGAASGTGDLYWWDQSLNDGLGDWSLAQSDVSFTINFYNSGQNGKGKKSTDSDTFGINIQYTPVSPPQPNALPNSDPQPLKGGDIQVN